MIRLLFLSSEQVNPIRLYELLCGGGVVGWSVANHKKGFIVLYPFYIFLSVSRQGILLKRVSEN